MRDVAVAGRRRGSIWIALAIALAIVVAVVALSGILAGPRAALPSASAAPSSGDAVGPTPTRTLVGLPDPKRTPGSINPNVTTANLASTICKRGWTATIRPPAAYTGALKVAQILEYGYADRTLSHYQEDHLVPLELGGAPRDPKNLWPEPNEIALPDGTSVGSAAKDQLEDALRRRVCAGTLALGDAQRLIAGDWIAAWFDAGRP